MTPIPLCIVMYPKHFLQLSLLAGDLIFQFTYTSLRNLCHHHLELVKYLKGIAIRYTLSNRHIYARHMQAWHTYIWHSVCGTLYTYGTQYMVHYMRHKVCGTQHATHCLWHTACDTLFVAHSM